MDLLTEEPDAGRVAAQIGLVSDTHMPERLRRLPACFSRVLEGVDLVLHAGDLGELSVLEKLSTAAAVVAVHGNDDSPAAIRELPEQQLLTVAGVRILLWHGHRSDRAEEKAARKIDAWDPILEHIAERGRQLEAQVVVFGHLHVPLVRQMDDVLLVNPGALASANPFTRQRVRTVAKMVVRDDGRLFVRHIDLAAPEVPFVFSIDWEAGFRVAKHQVSDLIVAPELFPVTWDLFHNGGLAAPELVRKAMLRLSQRCWAGKLERIERDDLLAAFMRDPKLPPADREYLRQALR